LHIIISSNLSGIVYVKDLAEEEGDYESDD